MALCNPRRYKNLYEHRHHRPVYVYVEKPEVSPDT